MAILWVLAVLAALAAGAFGGYAWANFRSLLMAEHEYMESDSMKWTRAHLGDFLASLRGRL